MRGAAKSKQRGRSAPATMESIKVVDGGVVRCWFPRGGKKKRKRGVSMAKEKKKTKHGRSVVIVITKKVR